MHLGKLSIGWGVETRSGYTDALVSALLDNASGTGPKSAQATGALEACAGLVGRSLSRCAVTGDDHGLVGPLLLASIGRQLVRTGSAVYVLSVRAGRVSLIPVCSWDVTGDVDPETWLYRVDLASPSSTFTRTASYAEVVHFKWSTDPARPWAGVAPMAAASGLAKLIGALEGGLGDDAGSPRGQVLSVAEGVDAGGDTLKELRSTIAKLSGRVAIIETTRHGSGAGQDAGTRKDFAVSRLGGQSTQAEGQLWQAARDSVASACGIPPSLLSKGGDGTGERESFRRWVATGLQPLADAVASEFRRVLETPIKLDSAPLTAQDTQGRARAASSLLGAGVEVERALRLSGLVTSDE